MKIHIASLCLRFYKRDGWNNKKIRELLVDKTCRVSYRKGMFNHSSYYAVYSIGFNKDKDTRFTDKILDHEIERGSIIGIHEIHSYIKYKGEE